MHVCALTVGGMLPLAAGTWSRHANCRLLHCHVHAMEDPALHARWA